MNDEGAEDLFSKVAGSIVSGAQVGKNPTKEDIRDEMLRLRDEGKDANEIGQQLGPYFMASSEHGEKELEMLEEVLTEEFEDYGN